MLQNIVIGVLFGAVTVLFLQVHLSHQPQPQPAQTQPQLFSPINSSITTGKET
jgi:hypothetical protein